MVLNCRTELCRFSVQKIDPGKGIRFIRADSQVFLFANSKCKRYFHKRLKRAKLSWTAMYRKQHKKDMHAEAVKKRRRTTKKPYSRSIVGASLEVIQKKRAEKPEVRDAAREAALRGTVQMTCDEKFAVLRSIGEECINEDELCLLLKKKPNPVCYVWFVPSPVMDIEQGILKTIYVNKMITAGCTVKILMADWFLQRHPKIGSNLNRIRTIGCYNIAMWKAAGMYLDRVDIIWLSDELNHHSFDYWPIAMDVSRKYTIERIAEFCLYMSPYGIGRMPAAELIYPCMQVAAVLCQKVDMWLFSMDQRDIILLARDYCKDINLGNKPTILLHGKLPNLMEDPEFEDKRDPGRTIFMLDKEIIVDFKIKCAFCPPKVAACNPCLEYIKSVVLPWFGKFEVVQKEGNDTNNKTFFSIEEIILNYESGDLDPTDIKLALGKAINDILECVAVYFRGNTEAQALITAPKFENEVTSDVQKIQMQNKEMFYL